MEGVIGGGIREELRTKEGDMRRLKGVLKPRIH